ncbi:MAG: antitoxin [Oscillospiraceae bacterium]|nr:antitoxin [Oscillospiraceae bacterium]
MAEMLRITSPLTGKSQIPQNKPEASPSEAFVLQDVNRVAAPQNKGEAQPQQNNTTQQEGMPAILMNLLKDPDVTVHFLKNISLLQELVKLLPVHNKTVSQDMEHLFQQLLVEPGDLAGELAKQEQGATSFRGELFDFLRGVLSRDAAGEMKPAVAGLLKALNGEMARKDILEAVGNSLDYLAETMAPSQKLASRLGALARAFHAPDAARHYGALKEQALEMVKDVQGSILYSPRIEKILSILQYDLSRFSTGETALEDAVAALAALLRGKDSENADKLTELLHRTLIKTGKGGGGKEASRVLDTLAQIIEKQAQEKELSATGADKLEKIIHSLLSSPCNYTPLLHYVIPLEQDGMKAFAEMWVNQRGEEDERPQRDGETENTVHLLLAFDMAGLGRFEAELYARDKKLEIGIFCPPEYVEAFSGVSAGIAKGAAQIGYRVEKVEMQPLERARSLMEVFKSLPYKRTGVDVKI